MDQVLVEKIQTILANAKDMTIATVRADGFPQATTVSYVSDGVTIYFACEPNAQKAENIALNNKVSVAVDLDYSDWNDIQSLSMGALAERVTEPDEMEKIGRLMVEKYPQIMDLEEVEPQTMALFRVSPVVVCVLDYSKGFGHTDLVEF